VAQLLRRWTLKGSSYSITERRVLELIPVLGSQPAGDVSHKPGGRLPLLSARPAVTPATLKRAATNFFLIGEQRHDGCELARMLSKTVTRQRRGCDLNPGRSAPESSTLTIRLPTSRFKNDAVRVPAVPLSGNNLGQFVRTHVPLSPSSII